MIYVIATYTIYIDLNTVYKALKTEFLKWSSVYCTVCSALHSL